MGVTLQHGGVRKAPCKVNIVKICMKVCHKAYAMSTLRQDCHWIALACTICKDRKAAHPTPVAASTSVS